MKKPFSKIFNLYVLAYAFFFASRPLDDGDFWWHLKTGQYIVEQGSIPRTDFFSFTNYGKPWIAHEWLSEVVFYLGYSWFGYNSLIFVFAVFTVIAFWLVTRYLDSHPFIFAPSVLLGIWSILPTIGARPRVFTLLLAAFYLALLNNFARNGKGWAIWLTIPTMAVWVNLHGGFLIGLVLIALTVAGLGLDRLVDKKPFKLFLERTRTLMLVFVGCAVAALLNPQGWRIYLFPFEVFFSPVQQQAVRDWLSPDFHQPELFPLAALILLTVAALTLSPRRPRPSEVLLFLSTLFATFKSNRHMAIFALVAVPLLINYSQLWLSSVTSSGIFSRRPDQAPARATILITVLLLLPLMIFAPRLGANVYGPPKQEMVRVPLKAVEYMKENNISGSTLTDPNIWSGYLIWATPSNPVYIDGRIDMYGDEFVKEYISIVRGTVDWKEPFERHNVKNVIVGPKSHLARSLSGSPEWQQLYQDEMSVVFSKRPEKLARASAVE